MTVHCSAETALQMARMFSNSLVGNELRITHASDVVASILINYSVSTEPHEDWRGPESRHCIGHD